MEILQTKIRKTEITDYITSTKSNEISTEWIVNYDGEQFTRILNVSGVFWQKPTSNNLYLNFLSSPSTTSSSSYIPQKEYSDTLLEENFKRVIRTKKLERII